MFLIVFAESQSTRRGFFNSKKKYENNEKKRVLFLPAYFEAELRINGAVTLILILLEQHKKGFILSYCL